MPEAPPDQVSPRDYLQQNLLNWQSLGRRLESLRARLAELQNQGPTGEAERQQLTQRIDAVETERHQTAREIIGSVKRHENLLQFAVGHGFPQERLVNAINQPDNQDGSASTGATGADQTTGKATTGATTATTTTKTNTGPGDVKSTGDHALAGIRGKDYHFERHGGDIYAIYTVPYHGVRIPISYKVMPSDYDALNINPGSVQHITDAQFRNLQYFGTTREMELHGDKRHPFAHFLHDLYDQHKDATWVHNKEVVGTYLQGFIENRDNGWLVDKIHQTDWWNSLTEYQQVYSDKSKTEQKQELLSWQGRLKNDLHQMFGTVNWQDHFDKHKLDRQIEKVANGAWGDPDRAYARLMTGIQNKAEKIEGTDAYSQAAQKRNAPEDTYEQLRSQAIEWLGYKGRPDDDTLRRMAKDVTYGKTSTADWMDFLRRHKQSLYPTLDQDETWQSGMSSYKQQAESLFGTTLSYNDRLFDDVFDQRDPTGKPVNARMSAYDFERKVRGDDRWWATDNAKQQGLSLVSFLDREFNGAGL